MYKNTLEFATREMAEVTDDRIAGVEIFPNSNTSTRLYVFCVYMPSANYSIDVYLDYLNTLYALYNSYSEVGTVIFLGDMNAEIIHSGKATQSLRDIKFTQFLENNSLTLLVHLPDCNGPKYSYITMEKC